MLGLLEKGVKLKLSLFIGPPADENEEILSPVFQDGLCSNGWVCEHRWPQIYRMIEFRNAVEGTKVENWWTDENDQIAFSRGSKGFIAFTNAGDFSQTLQTGLPAGVYCDIVSGSLENSTCTGKSVTVQEDGTATIEIAEDETDGFLAIHVNAKLS